MNLCYFSNDLSNILLFFLLFFFGGGGGEGVGLYLKNDKKTPKKTSWLKDSKLSA